MAVDSRGRPLKGTRRTLRSGTIAEPRPGYFVVRLRAGIDEHGHQVVHRRAGRVDRAVAERWLAEMGARPHSAPTPEPRPPRRRPARPAPVGGPRFDLAALDESLRRRALMADVSVARVLARLADVDPVTARRWLARGWLDVDRADVVATRLGRHPAEVWPSWVDVVGGEDVAA